MYFHLGSFSFTIIEECTIFALVQFLRDEGEQFIIIFKLAAVLVPYLVQAIQELQEDLGLILQVSVAVVTAAPPNHVPKG